MELIKDNHSKHRELDVRRGTHLGDSTILAWLTPWPVLQIMPRASLDLVELLGDGVMA
jgi:hypothetical protein